MNIENEPKETILNGSKKHYKAYLKAKTYKKAKEEAHEVATYLFLMDLFDINTIENRGKIGGWMSKDLDNFHFRNWRKN